MTEQVWNLLACPVCGAPMASEDGERTCRCKGIKAHCFDFARSGYLNLSGPHGGEGDGKDAVLSRRTFLDAGFYQPLSDAVNAVLSSVGAETVVDAGCGEGYYTNRIAQSGGSVLGIDLSRSGIDYAARRAKEQNTGAGFAVASLFSMPVQTGSADAIVNLFAPCAEAEFIRVLRPNGTLVLVGAGSRHLYGMKQVLYAEPYLNPGREDLPRGMTQVSCRNLTYRIRMEDREQIRALFSMTPYFWRTRQEDRDRLFDLDRLETEVDFTVFVYRKEC